MYKTRAMVDGNAAAKRATLTRHKAAFGLWLVVQQALEEVVIRDRNPRTAFKRAVDLLFIQAFKSHGSLEQLRRIPFAEMKIDRAFVCGAVRMRRAMLFWNQAPFSDGACK